MHFENDANKLEPIRKLHRAISIVAFLAICMLGNCLVSSAGLSSASGSQTSIDALANNISSDFGDVSDYAIYSTEKNVIVFQETHDSRAVQIETAIMLNRLKNRGLKIIALEGLAEGKKLDTQWLQELSDREVKIGVAVQMLEKGEISNAEFIAICYPEVEVIGVDNLEEYNKELSGDAASSAIYYIMAIAEKSMTQDQIADANELAEAGQTEEYVNSIVNSDSWSKEQYEKLYGKSSTTDSIEEKTELLDDIKKKADEMDADIDADTEKNFAELEDFYKSASIRSKTIASATLRACQRSPDAPVALILGAAHTQEVSKLLKDGSASYATISAKSFDKADDPSELDLDAFSRKLNKLSVDENGFLGSFLDKRDALKETTKKFAPVLDEVFFQSEYQTYAAAMIIARAAGSGDIPNDDLENELNKLDRVKIDISSIKKSTNGQVTFTSEVQDDDGKWLTIYSRVRFLDTQDEDIEKLLKNALEDVQKSEKNPQKLVKISPEVIGKFSLEPIIEDV